MAKSLRTAFIRVTANNNTENGPVVYSIDDIKHMVAGICDRYTNTKYAYITHDKDQSPDGPAPVHYHILLKFANPVPFKYIKEAFPYGNIEPARSTNACVQYLIHKNNPEKAQYDKMLIYTNYDPDAFAKLFTNDNKLQKVNEADELARVLEDIEARRCRRYNYFDYVDLSLWSKHKSQLINALEYAETKASCNPDRDLDVWFFTGNSGDGKTTLAKAYAKQLCNDYGFNGVAVSSSSNDPFNHYGGQDVIILDDLRDNAFTFQDLIKILDNHTVSSVRSRFNNKIFTGKLIIITSWQDLDKWYQGISENKKQLYRRITKYFKVTTTDVTEYDIVPEGNNSYRKEFISQSMNMLLYKFNKISKEYSKKYDMTKLQRFEAQRNYLAEQGIILTEQEEDNLYYSMLDEYDYHFLNGDTLPDDLQPPLPF